MPSTHQRNQLMFPNLKNESFESKTEASAARARKKRDGDDRYNAEIAVRICERIATSPVAMIHICEAPDMPSTSTLFRWLNDHPEFREMYVLAKEMQVELLLEQCLEIVDDDSRDLIETKDGRMLINTAVLRRHKMQVDFRKWLASKLLPRKYGNHRAAAAPKPESPAEKQALADQAAEAAKRAKHIAWLNDPVAQQKHKEEQEEWMKMAHEAVAAAGLDR